MYNLLYKQVSALCDESDLVAFLANVSACLNEGIPDINWVGFYFYRKDELLLGPFQGKVACSRLPNDKGVCATACCQKKTLYVPDVHQFDGHIACDSASNSELVIPLQIDGYCWGVLDIDSIVYDRFTEEEIQQLERIAALIAEKGVVL